MFIMSSYFRQMSFYCVLVLYFQLTVVFSAPEKTRSSVFGEIFKQEGGALCEDLKNLGYEGFECTTRSACGDDGYIQRSAITGDLSVWYDSDDSYDSYDENHQLDLENYECPNVRKANVEDYYSYDESYEDQFDEMVCCRNPAFYGKDDIPLSGIKDSCGYWQKHGFDCVDKVKCNDDGHYSTSPNIAITGIRSQDNDLKFTAQFAAASKSKCDKQEQVCCRKDTYFEKPFHATNDHEKDDANTQDINDNSVEKEDNPSPIIPSTTKGPICNISIRKGQGELTPRISSVQGAQEAGFADWPNMCIVLKSTTYRGDDFDLYQCGASMISPGIILTAAHCVDGKNYTEIKVRCGELDAKRNFTESQAELKPHQDRLAKHISVHPAFNPKNLYYDFALVHLDTPFDLDDHIFPICLPSQHSTPFIEDDDCYAMGYGKDSFGSDGYFSDVLKVAPMITVDSAPCQATYQTLKPQFQLHKSFMCAQGNGAGTCFGDGGSPLVCPNKNGDYIQFGIVAWGEKGCSGNKPDVFSDVTKALGFIDWATKCVEGQDVDMFGLSYFNRWAKRQFCINKGYIEDIKTQLSFANHPNEVTLRKEWRQYDYENRKFKAAIKNCGSGPKDIDCDIKDYIATEDDFNQVVERGSAYQAELNYDDLRRNDVVERSGF